MGNNRRRATPWIALAFVALLAAAVSGATKAGRDTDGREYFLTTPTRIDPAKTYWLVVGVHDRGSTGRGAGGASSLLAAGDCIIVGPTFAAGHETLPGEAERQVDGLIEQMGKQYKLHPKVFLHGIGAGAEMVSRYAMKRPAGVVGCSVHGGGSFPEAAKGAMRIPFFVGAGKSDPGYAAAKQFAEHLHSRRFPDGAMRRSILVVPLFYTGKTRLISPAGGVVREVYSLATTGLLRNKGLIVAGKVRQIEGMIRAKRFVEAARAIRALAILPGPDSLDAVRHASLAAKADRLLVKLSAAAAALMAASPDGSETAKDAQAVLGRLGKVDLARLQRSARSGVGVLTPREPRKNGQKRVLFVGNSLTFGNRLPHLVQAMSDAKAAKLIVGMDAIPAAMLGVHWNRLAKSDDDAGSLRVDKDDWDVVVLQDQSQAPAMSPRRTAEVGAKLCEHLKAKGIQPMFFLTWAYARSPRMVDALAKGYFAAASKGKVPVAPVGYAWDESLKTHKAIKLHASDGTHSAVNGAYLAACVFLMSLTGQSPVGLPDSLYYVNAFGTRQRLPTPRPEDAKKLQAIAEKTVREFCRKHPDMAPPAAVTPSRTGSN